MGRAKTRYEVYVDDVRVFSADDRCRVMVRVNDEDFIAVVGSGTIEVEDDPYAPGVQRLVQVEGIPVTQHAIQVMDLRGANPKVLVKKEDI